MADPQNQQQKNKSVTNNLDTRVVLQRITGRKIVKPAASGQKDRWDIEVGIRPTRKGTSIPVRIRVQDVDGGDFDIKSQQTVIMRDLELDPSRDAVVVLENSAFPQHTDQLTIRAAEFGTDTSAKAVKEPLLIRQGSLTADLFNPIIVIAQSPDGKREKRVITLITGQPSQTRDQDFPTGRIENETDDAGVFDIEVKLLQKDATVIVKDNMGNITEVSMLHEP